MQVELVHFVDPGMDRVKNDFTPQAATVKMKETLHWISQCHVDAILVTCTYFTARLPDAIPSFSLPIIKIDQPLFDDICMLTGPVIVAFTNPSTVDGTIGQLQAHSELRGKNVHVTPALLPDTFPLLMQGKKEAYTQKTAQGLRRLIEENPDKHIVAGQLSMAPAAELAAQQSGITIGNQLHSLTAHIQMLLDMK
ncbi:hypothetical protein [Paenibacillus oenotherae]|uniref:hypothetical protein n=1 Tax=Paenibacillus oenotherae TaxID=1435645 RepID=UPI001FEB78E2|nr:hypothetical protein [Paenibacillus oenotherae]